MQFFRWKTWCYQNKFIHTKQLKRSFWKRSSAFSKSPSVLLLINGILLDKLPLDVEFDLIFNHMILRMEILWQLTLLTQLQSTALKAEWRAKSPPILEAGPRLRPLVGNRSRLPHQLICFNFIEMSKIFYYHRSFTYNSLACKWKKGKVFSEIWGQWFIRKNVMEVIWSAFVAKVAFNNS